MNKKLMTLAALVFAVVLTGYSVSGTYAKYTEDLKEVTDQATVAKWSVGTMKDINMFSQNYIAYAEKDGTYQSGNSVSGKSGEVVAPGAFGALKIEFDETGFTDMEVNYKLHLENLDMKTTTKIGDMDEAEYYPFVYYLVDASDIQDNWQQTWASEKRAKYESSNKYTDLSSLVAAINEKLDAKVFAAQTAPTESYAIVWEWPFDALKGNGNTDEKDTQLGEKGSAATYTFSIDVKATQTTEIAK